MKKTLATLVMTLTMTLAMATLSFAHGKGQQLMGTVSNISSGAITVKTTANTTQTIAISSGTKFLKSGAPAAVKDLKQGDRVVVEIEKQNGTLQAESVRFGKAGSNGKAMKHDMSKMKQGMSNMSR